VLQEAETLALLGNVAVNADPTHGVFTGTGYVDGIVGPGDGVAGYVIENPSIVDQVAVLKVRYAAGGADSIGDRTISVFTRPSTGPVDGANHITTVAFPELASQPNAPYGWEVWGTRNVAIPVPAQSTIAVDFAVDGREQDRGVLSVDYLELDSCQESMNRAPQIVGLNNLAFEAGTGVDVPFQVIDPDGDGVTFTIVGGPPGLSVVADAAPANGYRLVGPTGAGLILHNMQMIVTDNGTPALSSSEPFELDITLGLSPWAGKIGFTEVINDPTNVVSFGTAESEEIAGGNNESFPNTSASFPGGAFEIRNLIPDANDPANDIDLAGWRLFNFNPTDGWSPNPTALLDWTFPAMDPYGDDSPLPGGQRVVITSRDLKDATVVFANGNRPFDMAEGKLAQADQQHALQPIGSTLQFINPVAGELWLVDDQGRAVSYVAWGASGTGALLTSPPDAAWGLWDDANQLNLAGSNNRSISLATDGPDGWNSACWEQTATGSVDLNGGCAAQSEDTIRDELNTIEGVSETYVPVIWDLSDLFNYRTASLGKRNTANSLPLPPNAPPPAP